MRKNVTTPIFDHFYERREVRSINGLHESKDPSQEGET